MQESQVLKQSVMASYRFCLFILHANNIFLSYLMPLSNIKGMFCCEKIYWCQLCKKYYFRSARWNHPYQQILFITFFYEYVGTSPINYLMETRLAASKELLLSSSRSIAEVASSTGFSSQSYFSQIFRKNTGMSPLQYRKLKQTDSKTMQDDSYYIWKFYRNI